MRGSLKYAGRSGAGEEADGDRAQAYELSPADTLGKHALRADRRRAAPIRGTDHGADGEVTAACGERCPGRRGSRRNRRIRRPASCPGPAAELSRNNPLLLQWND
ncbi:hypothetical protein GCM10022384_38370 [Streptomyces marokkonensis]|uniref:Uncharacterized protein n=1 Tax=Streptomyces marokkonensis TaxID=324855 RepID=A0ABP7QQZ4_9ACTN